MKTNTNTKTDIYSPEINALADFLRIEPNEITDCDFEHYGLKVFGFGSREYAVGTDLSAQIAVERYVKDSIWAFNASFILSYCGLPMELEEAIKAFQEEKCEGANDALLALVEKDGLEGFVEQAVAADGRGHFLSPYNGEENEQDGYYIYRIN